MSVAYTDYCLMPLSVARESAVAMYEVYCFVNFEIKFDFVAAEFDVAEDSVLSLHPFVLSFPAGFYPRLPYQSPLLIVVELPLLS
jgi:hypothetical protein